MGGGERIKVGRDWAYRTHAPTVTVEHATRARTSASAAAAICNELANNTTTIPAIAALLMLPYAAGPEGVRAGIAWARPVVSLGWAQARGGTGRLSVTVHDSHGWLIKSELVWASLAAFIETSAVCYFEEVGNLDFQGQPSTHIPDHIRSDSWLCGVGPGSIRPHIRSTSVT